MRLRVLMCLLAGHDYEFIRVDPLSWLFQHIHITWGCDCVCRRCGYQVLDYDRFQRS